MDHKNIVNKMKTVYELFLKFSETYRDKRKQIWWDKDQMFRGKMKKGLGVQIMTLVKFEKLKAKCNISIADDEKYLHQDNGYGNYVMKYSNAADPSWAKTFVRKERVVKHITNQRYGMACMSVTIQKVVSNEEVISAYEEWNSHFDTKILLAKYFKVI